MKKESIFVGGLEPGRFGAASGVLVFGGLSLYFGGGKSRSTWQDCDRESNAECWCGALGEPRSPCEWDGKPKQLLLRDQMVSTQRNRPVGAQKAT